MPNLHDVIEITKPPTNATLTKQSNAEIKRLIDQAQASSLFMRSLGIEVGTDLADKVNTQIKNIRKEVFGTNQGVLPASLITVPQLGSSKKEGGFSISTSLGKDVYSILSETVKTRMSSIRKSAEALGMSVMPFEVLDDRSYKNEGYTTRSLITNFTKAIEVIGWDLYVVAPIKMYDLTRHVKSKLTNLQFYSPTHQMVFTTMQLQIPLFRSFKSSIETLNIQVGEIQALSKNMQAQIDSLKDQLDSIQSEIENQRKREIFQQMEQQHRETENRKVLDSWVAMDPLLFAIPKESKLNDDVTVIVGPAWGPEFTQELLEACGITNNSQSAQITADLIKSFY